MNKQLSIYFEEILSKFQCGFRKGFSTQHCLLLMLEKWKQAVDNNKVFGALLTDLSKAFDCISHDLLIAKLNAYGLSLSALKSDHPIVSGKKLFQVFHKDQFWDHFRLKYFYVICF